MKKNRKKAIEWTKEMDRVLEDLVAKGMNRRVIAEILTNKFKVKVTKNSAIGRAHRIGAVVLQPRDFSRPVEPPDPPRVVKKAPQVVVVRKERYVPKAEAGGCQYLHGDAVLRNFCDKPRVRSLRQSSGMWCKEHEALVYTNPAKR